MASCTSLANFYDNYEILVSYSRFVSS